MSGENFLKQNLDRIQALANSDKLRDLGTDITKNAQGFIDAGKDFADKTLGSVTSLLFGKTKRLSKSVLAAFPDGKAKFNMSSPAIEFKASGETKEKDWRVSLSVPTQVMNQLAGQNSLLDPLKKTGNKLVFPYTPTVLVGHSASWNPMQPVHTNYPFYAYENSRVEQMTITADFYVQNEQEAKYWVAAVHYLRSMTKMAYGQSADRGQPPPIVYLNGYGDFTFNNVPVIITSFQFDLKREVDYISTKLQVGGGNSSAQDTGDVAPQKGSSGYAWAPTESLITVGVIPQYSRTKQSQFNLQSFIKGDHTLKGDGFI